VSIPEPLPRSTTVSPDGRPPSQVVADAGERVDRLARNGVELGSRVSEALGKRAPGLEMKIFVWLVCDLAIHLLDASLEVLRVDGARLCCHLVLLLPRCAQH
jgi:hypothetical protein